MKTTPNR